MTDRDVTETGRGKTAFGGDWKVGADGARLLVIVDGIALVVEGGEWEKFSEAVARADMPGRVSGKRGNHGPGCRCMPCLAEPSYQARRQVTP